MTGKGHQISGLIVAVASIKFAYSYDLSMIFVPIGVIIGACAPDYLEICINKRRLITHRTITHWLPLWVLGIFLSFNNYETINNYSVNVADLMIGFFAGGLLHLLLDIPNPMGVPVLTPFHRVSLNLWKSGNNEYLILTVLTFASFGYFLYEYLPI